MREGAGLVLLHPFVGDVKGHPFKGDEAEGDARIWDISPLVGVPDDRVSDRGYPEPNTEAITQARWEAVGRHPITDGADLALIPSGARGGRFYVYQARGDVLVSAGGHPVVATRSYGKGRVVAFAYAGEGFIPEPVDPVATRTYWDYWEYEYALLARSILWAARRETDVRVASLSASADEGLHLALSVGLADAAVARGPAGDATRPVEIEVGVKSAFGGAPGRRTHPPRPPTPGRTRWWCRPRISAPTTASRGAGRSSSWWCGMRPPGPRSTSAGRASTCRARPRSPASARTRPSTARARR